MDSTNLEEFPFLPMLPLHLLVQNLLYDVSQIAIPFDSVDEEQVKYPQSGKPDDTQDAS
jgi:Mg2+-importing ATPase